MKLADFIVRDAISNDLDAATKEEAIRSIIDRLIESGHIKQEEREGVFQAIMRREELGSTGIGNGIAVPHTKHPSAERMVGTVAVTKGKIDFQSIDGDPVDIIVLLVSPPDRPGDHLRALELITRNLREEIFCRFLRNAKSVAEIGEVLDDADNNRLLQH